MASEHTIYRDISARTGTSIQKVKAILNCMSNVIVERLRDNKPTTIEGLGKIEIVPVYKRGYYSPVTLRKEPMSWLYTPTLLMVKTLQRELSTRSFVQPEQNKIKTQKIEGKLLASGKHHSLTNSVSTRSANS